MQRKLLLITLISFLTGILAPACGFAWGGKFSVVEICTTQGIEHRVVENENGSNSSDMSENCNFCFQAAHCSDYLPASTNILFAFAKPDDDIYSDKHIIIDRNFYDHRARAPPPSLV